MLKIWLKIFFFFRNNPSPSQKTPPYLHFSIRSLHLPTLMATQNQIVEDLPSSQLKQNTFHTEQTFIEQKNRTNQMKYNEFQKKKIQYLMHTNLIE